MNIPKIYNDPVIARRRNGTTGDPFRQITETLSLNRNYALLTEIPNRFNRVQIKEYYEITDGEIEENQFRVDYVNGIVFFHDSKQGVSLTFTYLGEGAYLFPDTRIYVTGYKDGWTLNDKLKDVDRLINEQKNRVDTLIRETPQPDEILDVRTDRNGKVFPVARDRINSEQEKIEEAYEDLNKKKYSSLKKRLDADQKMVDDAFLSSDESQLFDNLDARLRFDHTQIHKRVDDEVEKINQRFLREVNVLDFGAKGDGKADDTKAIQDAMNLAEKDKFIKITFPHGVFKITSTLRVKMNTHLHLSEQTTILKEFGGYMLANGMPDDEFTKYDGNSNITVDGGVWDYNGVKFPQMANCFAFGHSQNIVFKNLTIKDVAGSHAIELNSSREVQFLNCKFLGFIDTGGRSFSEAIQLDLAKGAGYFGAFGGYDNTQCHNVLVQGCYFGESGTRGSGAWPRGVGSHAATIGRWHSYITIVDNIFENLTMQAIRAFSWNHLIVSNNHIINCGSAVNVVPPKHSSNPNNTIDVDGVQTNKSQNVYNFKITNNLIRGGGAHSSSIRIQSEKDVWIYGVVVSGNTISQKQGNTVGVYLRGVSRAVVSNNVIHENQASGLSLRDCYSLVVDGNSLTNIGTNAISANGVQMLTISGNSIDYCGGKGMSIQACQQATISGNSVKRTTTYGIHIHTNSLGFTISGNTIIGSGRKNPGEAGSQCIRITTNSSNGAVTGNLLRGWGEDYEPSYGIWVTATTYRIFVTGNNSPGLDAYFSGNQPSSNKHTANSWN